MLKIISAYLLFLVLIATGLGYGFRFYFKSSDKNVQAENNLGFTPLFYKSLGQIPAKVSNEPEQELSDSKYTLEFQTVASEQEAKRQLELLKDDPGTAYYTPVRVGDRTMFKIRKGVFSSKEGATKLAEKIQAEKGLAATIEELF